MDFKEFLQDNLKTAAADLAGLFLTDALPLAESMGVLGRANVAVDMVFELEDGSSLKVSLAVGAEDSEEDEDLED